MFKQREQLIIPGIEKSTAMVEIRHGIETTKEFLSPCERNRGVLLANIFFIPLGSRD